MLYILFVNKHYAMEKIYEKEAYYKNASAYTKKQKTFEVILEMSDGSYRTLCSRLYQSEAYRKALEINRNLGIDRALQIYR